MGLFDRIFKYKKAKVNIVEKNPIGDDQTVPKNENIIKGVPLDPAFYFAI